MTHPLVETLSKTDGTEIVGADTLEMYLKARTDCLTLLFFPGHDARKLETPDVAVVLVELKKMFGDLVRVAIVSAEDERSLMGRCAVLMLPSISIFHGDQHLQTIGKIQDWEVYARDLPALLERAELVTSSTH